MTTPPLDAEEHERWRAEADRALRGAQVQAEVDLHNWACFAAEQAAQLAVKGLLHGVGRAPWGQDLVRLGAMLAEAGIQSPEHVADAMRRLGRHYIPSRYPDAHPLGPPGDHYGAADAREALSDAATIIAFVDVTWTDSMAEVLADRAHARDALIGIARGYVERLAADRNIVAAIVVGSVARGDFNVWSDIDVVVVADDLPDRARDRAQALGQIAPPRVQPIGFTRDEFRAAHARGNPVAREATEVGIPLAGADFVSRGSPKTAGR